VSGLNAVKLSNYKMLKLLSLSAGGILGTLSRYYISKKIYTVFGSNFPYGTFVVNVAGCFFIGFFASIAERKLISNPEFNLFFIVGFCGAFTTFSTYIFETNSLVGGGELFKGLANIVISVAVGFIALKIGLMVGKGF